MMTLPRFLRIVGPSLFMILWFACGVIGQTETATVSGLVTDRTGAAVPGAEMRLQSVDRGAVTTTTANDAGIYVFPSVQPGQYQLSVDKQGFKQVDLLRLIVNVQDHIEQNFRLEVGSVTESVTVEAAGSLINTTDASVSTVVDRQFVENSPMNGRSFQSLILLTPGVTTVNPQTQNTGGFGGRGEFNVSGQRSESNSTSVDGVSADVLGSVNFRSGIASYSGSLPAATAAGTTQALVSLDALEEFRVQSSSYSAEYGRHPGGQFSFVTRSGTNEWHGSAFDYLRNNFFDANDWFTNFFMLPRAPERQNDFGGTLGGPLHIPRVYDGKDKTFFFFSYEGLRLDQPQPGSINEVPDASLRQNAPAPLQAVMNAFPLPSPGAPDLGNNLTEFIAAWSNRSKLDAVSIRLDHVINEKLRLFFRFSDTPSESRNRDSGDFIGTPSTVTLFSLGSRTYTLGATSAISHRIANEFRLNYSTSDVKQSAKLDGFGGAKPTDLAKLSGVDPQAMPSSHVNVTLAFPNGFSPSIEQGSFAGNQKQWNLVDTLSVSVGAHQLKFGVDYRRLPSAVLGESPVVYNEFDAPASVTSNSVDFGIGQASGPLYPVYTNFSAFVADAWRVAPRLTLSIGLRWEVNPAPGCTRGKTNLPYTLAGDYGDLSTLSLAPQGTPLWKTTWYNFAPRVGVAYVLRDRPGRETVMRSGGGVFFDTGQQLGSSGYNALGFSSISFFGPTSFPAPLSLQGPAIVNPPVAPYGVADAFYPHLQLPYTWQWNLSVEQALGKSQALTVSYVGSAGRRLLQENEILLARFNPNFQSAAFLFKNGLTSDYDSLQLQFQRRLSRGLDALASYTWAHSIDYGSVDSSFPSVRGNSDFDVRHNVSGALSYDVPSHFRDKFVGALFNRWGIDDRFTARTAFPITLNGRGAFNLVNGQRYFSGLNLVSGQPLYVDGPQYPGGRSINPAAFTLPVPGQVGNAPRNFVHGFGAWQMDLAVRREFPIYERLRLQFRAEAFNVFNHPNFGTINSLYCAPGPFCTFGQATATLAHSLNGLSALYQMGGPRSMQFALKLAF